MEDTSQCSQCLRLKEDIRSQIDAFRTLASLNPNLDTSILLGNLEELVGASNEDVLKAIPEIQTDSIVVNPNTCRVVDDNDDGTGQDKIMNVEETLSDPSPVATHSTTPAPRKSGRSKWRGSWEDKCRQIIDDLWLHGDALPFRYPVNLKQCPDYNMVIKKPMCFENIKEKLYGELYTEPLQFHQDLLLIFQNCRTYNNDPTIYAHKKICDMAQILEKRYESCVQKLKLFDNLNVIYSVVQTTAAASSFSIVVDDKKNRKKGRQKQQQRDEKIESCRVDDYSKLTVTNPFPNFDLEAALSVKVGLDRLNISTLSTSYSSSSLSSPEESHAFHERLCGIIKDVHKICRPKWKEILSSRVSTYKLELQ